MTKTIIVNEGIDLATLWLDVIPRKGEPLQIDQSSYMITAVINGIDTKMKSLTVVIQVVEI